MLPGLSFTAAHCVPPTLAQLNWIIFAPLGSAAKSDPEVQVAPAGEAVAVGDGLLLLQYFSNFSGRPALAVPQTSSDMETSQVEVPSPGGRTLVGPGSTFTAAHWVPPTSAQSNLTMVEPSGSAARIESVVHSAVIGAVVAVAVGLSVGAVSELDEHPATVSAAMPTPETSSADLRRMDVKDIGSPLRVSSSGDQTELVMVMVVSVASQKGDRRLCSGRLEDAFD